MKHRSRLILAGVLAATLFSGGQSIALDENSYTGDKASDMMIDLVVVRPIGLVGTVIGAAAFVVALPFTIPTNSVGASARGLVGEPAEYTFNRPLGEFRVCGADRHPCGAR